MATQTADLVDVPLRRKHIRAAAKHRRDFNEGESPVFDWAANSPVAYAIKDYYGYDRVFVHSKQVSYQEEPGGRINSFYMSNKVKGVVEEVDKFVKNEAYRHPHEHVAQFGANNLYDHLKNQGMLVLPLKGKE